MSSFGMPNITNATLDHLIDSVGDVTIEENNEEYYDLGNDNLSDISDELLNENDPFEEDNHLINYGEFEIDGELQGDNVKLLSLDEVPFDRDIRYVNVAVGSRPRTLVQVNNGSSRRVMNQVNSLTSSNHKEVRQLDEHYKKLDHFKKNHDKKFDDKRGPRQIIEYTKRNGHNKTDVLNVNEKQYRPREKSNYPGKGGNHVKSERTRRPNQYNSGGRNNRSRDFSNPSNHSNGFVNNSPQQNIELLDDNITTIDIMDSRGNSGLRADAPEFVPFSWAR